MSGKLFITHYCHIRDAKLDLDGVRIFESDPDEELRSFLKKAYRFLEMKYPKYFKMDHLSKLAVLGAELLFKQVSVETFDRDVALCFSNRASSLDTDRKHQETISNPEQYYPSPAVFVYTLPNIGMGEISIRHGLKSENSFFIFEAFKPEFHEALTNRLVADAKTNAVLNAWIEVDGESYDVFMYLVSKSGKIPHTKENIEKLYQKAI